MHVFIIDETVQQLNSSSLAGINTRTQKQKSWCAVAHYTHARRVREHCAVVLRVSSFERLACRGRQDTASE